MMTHTEHALAIKTRISEGKTSQAIDELIAFFKEKDKQLFNQCLLHKANYTSITEKMAINAIDRREGQSEIARINYALLELTDKIDTSIVEKTNTFRTNTFLNIKTLAAVFIVILGAVLMYFFTKTGKNDVRDGKEAYEESLRQRKNNNIDKSIEYATKAIGYQPDNADAYNLRAECYLLKDVLDAAFIDARRSIQIDSNNCYTYSTLAQIEALRKNDKGFFENIEKSLQHGCEMWKYTKEKGIVLYADNQDFINMLMAYKSLNKN